MDKIYYLSQFNLLYSLSEEDLIEMEQLTLITSFPKNTFIQTPDTFAEKLYFVKRGKVRLYILNAAGKQFTLDLLEEGNVFGELNQISLGTRDMYIEAVEDSDICSIDKVRFEHFLLRHPRFMMSLLKVLGERIQQMSSLTQQLALGSLQDKIMHILFKLADQFGLSGHDTYRQINLPLSHQDIAHFVGATREAVSAALQDLAAKQIIQTGFKAIYLRQEDLQVRDR